MRDTVMEPQRNSPKEATQEDLPFKVAERPSTGNEMADTIIEYAVEEALIKLKPIIADEIIQILKDRFDISGIMQDDS